jgi:hypothetical protein
MPDWLLESLLSRVIWEVLLILGVGAVLGYLKAKLPELAPRILYGLAGATCVSILLFAFTGRPVFSKAPSETTVDNVEQNIRTWLDSYGVAVTKEDVPNSFFAYGVTLRNGVPVQVLRPKDRDRYIGFRVDVAVGPQDRAAFDKMSSEQQRHVLEDVTLEMTRSKATYDLVPPAPQLQKLMIIKTVPITNALTESSFATALDEMNVDALLASKSIVMAIERDSTPTPPSH